MNILKQSIIATILALQTF